MTVIHLFLCVIGETAITMLGTMVMAQINLCVVQISSQLSSRCVKIASIGSIFCHPKIYGCSCGPYKNTKFVFFYSFYRFFCKFIQHSGFKNVFHNVSANAKAFIFIISAFDYQPPQICAQQKRWQQTEQTP